MARRLAAVASAPLDGIAELLRDALRPVIGHRALIIFTEDCTGRLQKKAGDTAVTDHATIAELDAIRHGPLSGGRTGRAAIAHAEHSVPVWRAVIAPSSGSARTP